MKQCIVFGLLLMASVCMAQEQVGLFENQTDIGEPGIPGLVNFQDDVYSLEAGGAGIGYRRLDDSFYFVNTELSGNFAIEGFPEPLGTSGWGGLMVRDTLDADSPHASIMIATTGRGTNSTIGSFHPFFRSSKGGGTKTDGDYEPGGWTDGHVGNVRLERIGNTFRFYSMNSANEWVLRRTEVVPMTDPVYVGLAATADNNDNLTFYDFSQVSIEEFPATVERDLPTDELQPGAVLNPVTLTARVRDGLTEDLLVTEIPPVGGTISNVLASGGIATLNPNGTITWDLPGASGVATLTYDLQLGTQSAATFRGTFNMGEVTGNFLAGEAILPKIPSFQSVTEPIEVDPVFPTVIQAEQGTPLTDNAWFLMVFPQSENGVVTMSANGTAAAALEFPLRVSRPGTYYMFALVRGEDGNSDSFRTEIDVPPGGPSENGIQYWTINGNKVWFFDWISGEADSTLGTPAINPRPFELLEGENYFYIGNREDDASIDYFVITPNPNFNIAGFSLANEQTFQTTRDLPQVDGALPASVQVTVDLNVRAGVSQSIVVSETAPKGWALSGITASVGTATVDGNVITWEVPTAANGTLAYTATPAAGDTIGVFSGNSTNGVATLTTLGDVTVPTVLQFELLTDPIDIGTETVFIQAEKPHAVSGNFEVRADATLPSLLYAITTTGGSSGGITQGRELTFNLNVLQTGVYYIFAKCRGENDQTDSFFIGFDVEFNGQPDSDDYGYSISTNGMFERRWYQTYDPAGRFWDVTGEPRPFELTAGAHTLNWHAREAQAKVDWIAITMDPTLDIDAILEPGEEETAVHDFMLY